MKRQSEDKRVDGVFFDFHTHLPYWIRDPARACERLLLEEISAGSTGAIVIGVDASVELVTSKINAKTILDAAMEDFDLLAFQSISYLNRMVVEPEKFLDEFVGDFYRHRRGLEDLVKCAEIEPEFFHLVVSNVPGEERRIAELVRSDERILGVKIFPTFHMTRPDSKRLDELYKTVQSVGGLIVVHTGCDPGPWELTKLCMDANPKYVIGPAKKYPDLTFVIAHLGSYSALKPGIFFNEALKALELENVYSDTSAADPFFVSLAVKEGFEDKLMFGTDFPYVMGYGVSDVLREFLSLNLEGKIRSKILMQNALKLLSKLPRGRV
ncbi:MAG: amidohydrolase family protein [Aeropyrum sp.]|nr:amidohydrolase family protein [Aeropyrum sp.]